MFSEMVTYSSLIFVVVCFTLNRCNQSGSWEIAHPEKRAKSLL